MRNLEDTLQKLALEIDQLGDAITAEYKEMSEYQKACYVIEISRGLDPTKNPEYKAFKHHTYAKTDSDVDRLRHLARLKRFELDFLRKWKKEWRKNE